MNAKELRIGNHVYNNYEKFITIRGLILNECFSDISGYSYEEIEPIPLSEEWLKRFGFKYTQGDGYELGLLSVYFTNGTPIVEISYDGGIGSYQHADIYVDCEYVHQLQNLYFALTGEELTLKSE